METFDKNIVRFIQTFAEDVRKDVWFEMGEPPDEWNVCAVICGQTHKYKIPDGTAVGDAIRMFPEFASL